MMEKTHCFCQIVTGSMAASCLITLARGEKKILKTIVMILTMLIQCSLSDIFLLQLLFYYYCFK